MQGLWKDKNKYYFKDKIQGVYGNSEGIKVNFNKLKKSTPYKKRINIVEKEEDKIDQEYEVKHIRFKRAIRLTNKFVKRNCDTCEYNHYFKNENKETYIEGYGYKSWCRLDEYSYNVKRWNSEFYKRHMTYHFQKNTGCDKSIKFDIKYEYKIFKVISYQENYFDIKTKKYINSDWEIDKVLKYKKTFKSFYTIEKRKREKEYGGHIVYNGKLLSKKEIEYFEERYKYCYYKPMRECYKKIRSKNKNVLDKMRVDNYIEKEFIHEKKSYKFYCY